MKKYDVGIFGWWYNMNYGANLTYFSLNRAIQKMGYSVGMVWKGITPDTLPDNTATRFANKYYDIGPVFAKEEMQNHNDFYKAFVLGSDQLWSPKQEHVSGKEFFFSFVEPGKKKVAYAQSVGRNVPLPKDFISKYKDYAQSFDAVSVREDYASKLIKEGFEVDAPQVCDPIFLSEVDIWNELINNARISLPSEYVVNLILDPDEEKMNYCKSVRKMLGISEYINFTALTPKVPWEKKFGKKPIDNTDGSIEKLVKAYSEAKFIVTDSFHGTCLAIIFNKPFISIANYKRGVERFESLLRWLGIENRLIYDVKAPPSLQLKKLDYEKANAIIIKSRKDGLRWLKNNLKGSRSISCELGQTKCIGCGACVCVCPTLALSLNTDKFGYYRSFLKSEKCIECKKCISVCPALELPEKKNSKPELYMFQANDDDILEKSSSGGVFQLIAQNIIAEGGYVAGVVWDRDFSCKHIMVDSPEDIESLGKSKYMQSYMGDIIKQIKMKTDEGKTVLFSGCPCQVAAVHKYFGEEPVNLITIDILCGNSPSPLFFKKYIDDEFGESLKEYTFRDKKNGWNCRDVKIKLNNNQVIYRKKKDNDPYQSVFHNHTMTPKHCELCKYQSLPRFGDITIGDFWKIDHKISNFDTTKGISAVLCNNKKGKAIFDSIPSAIVAVNETVPLEWLGGNGFAYKGNNFASPSRDLFYSLILDHSFGEVLEMLKKQEMEKQKKVFINNKTLMDCDFNTNFFDFEEEYWEEWHPNGYNAGVCLRTKQDNTPKGHFATFHLRKTLSVGKVYRFLIMCTINSDSHKFNFHIADEKNAKNLQIIHSHKLKKDDIGGLLEIEGEFECKKEGMNAFSIGAGHLLGKQREIYFRYVGIAEK